MAENKRYGIANESFPEFVWLMREAGIEWSFVDRPRPDGKRRTVVDVDVEVGAAIAIAARL